MKEKFLQALFVVLFTVFVPGTVHSQAQDPVPPAQVSAVDAHNVLAATSPWVHMVHYAAALSSDAEDLDVGSLQVLQNEIRVDAMHKGKTNHLHLELKPGEQFGSACNKWNCMVYLKSTNKNPDFFDQTQRGRYFLNFGTNGSPWGMQKDLCVHAVNGEKEACINAAAQFAAALNALLRSPTLANFNAEEFHRKAVAWRALATKPELTEDVRTRRLLAEDAIKNNKPEEALKFYDEGVVMDPTWAQGWFNAGLVAAQMSLYADAVLYMQNYLELMPDAADAASARDQMTVWKFKAQQK